MNTQGTAIRSDDEVTTYSSRGPTAYDFTLKPDLVAPGNKVVSLEAPYSYLSTTYPERQVPGGYLQLSGTSMSAAVVSGAVALLLESNPTLTPQQVKISLQSAASPIEGAGLVEAGAGSLNVVSAIYTALLGPTAELPMASIEGEAVDIGGLIFADQVLGDGQAGARTDGQTLVWGNTLVWGTPWFGGTLWFGGTPWFGGTLWFGGTPWFGGTLWFGGTPWFGGTLWFGGTP